MINKNIKKKMNFFEDNQVKFSSALPDGLYHAQLKGGDITQIENYPHVTIKVPFKMAIRGDARILFIVKKHHFQILEMNGIPVNDPSEYEVQK